MRTSATGGLMLVGAVATLLVESLSVAPVVDTRTVLVTVWLTGVVVLVAGGPGVAPEPSRSTSVKTPVAVAVSDEMVHVTVPVASAAGVLHAQSSGAVSRWNVIPDGTTSVSEALGASDGPLLVAV